MSEATGPTTFSLLPAIDLRGGRVVRLERGDFEHETAFADSPLAVAEAFARAGAAWLHLVDLDGARAGGRPHGDVIQSIVDAVGTRMAVEVAGGLRSASDITSALAAGAARVVVGTRALSDPGFVADQVAAHGPERVVVALDVRDGSAVGHGWDAGSPGVPLDRALAGLLDAGAAWFEVTAIARDGMLSGPDIGLLERALRHPGARVIASGGIATVGDLRRVRSIGCAGAIVGRALYDGSLRIEDALAAASG